MSARSVLAVSTAAWPRRVLLGVATLGGACTARVPSPPSEDTLSTGTWSSWTLHPDAHYEGQAFEGVTTKVASDPCVVKDGELFRMFYTCFTDADRGGLCSATSPDGVTWTRTASIVEGIEGAVVIARPGEWDANVETCSVVRTEQGFEVYYSGYENPDAKGHRAPAALGRLTSTDGVTLTRDPDEPVLTPVPGDYDGDDVFSAVEVVDGDVERFVYTAWCVDGYNDGQRCSHTPAIQIAGATRAADGTFTRQDAPVLQPREDVDMMRWGVAEPDLIHGPDGAWYLFFTGGLGDEPRVTGLARGDGPFGPWEIDPNPIVAPSGEAFDVCGAFAPSVVVDGDVVHMWYLTMDDCGGTCPSCDAEACGCAQSFTVGYATASWPLIAE